MKILNLDRIAFEALRQIKKNEAKEFDGHAFRNAALNLAHHLRAHGLSATVGYGMANDDTLKITQAFVGALDTACPIAGANINAQAQALKTEATPTYLLHSRLALPLADGFALAAKALWPTDDSTEQESSHV